MMYVRTHRRIRYRPHPAGLGDARQVVGTSMNAVAVGASAAGIATAAGAGAAAGPIGIAVGALVGLLGFLLGRKGPQQKVASTQIVDQVEPYMKANLAAYQAGQISQAQALANFDSYWGQVQQSCGDPQLGDPGQRCIQDRNRGGRWDWFALYRDPIAQDDRAHNDVISAAGAAVTSDSGLWLALALVAAGALL